MTTESEKTSLQLSKLLDELNDDHLAALSDDEVLKLRKELNPYGRTIEGADKVLTFSYTDLQADYLKKMMLTTMVGFLNRMLDEWRVSPGIPVVTVYDYVKDPSKIDDFEKTLQKPELLRDDLDNNKELMKKKVFIKEFLEDMFQYNPDLHVRSSYKPNTKDDERTVLSTPAAHLAISQLKSKSAEFREEMLQYDRQSLLHEKAQSAIESKEETSKNISEENVEQKTSLPEIGPILTKLVSDVRKRTTELIPPVDIFHRFQYYHDSNFEELQHIVNDLYCCKPDFTTAINPYAWFDTEEEADKFISKHKDEVISTIFKAHSGKWTIIAPFKEVRDSTRFFNKNTQVLENIMDQIEKDSKLGQELMKKRIKIQKKKNVEKEGPDDPAFKKWRSKNTVLKDMGAVHPDDEKNNALGDEDDLPDDALEVPVFRVSQGGTKIKRSKFYTKAVAPDIDNLPKDGDSGPSES